MIDNDNTDIAIVVLSHTIPRQLATNSVARLVNTVFNLRSAGKFEVARQVEDAFMGILEYDGLNITLPVIMEMRNETQNCKIWEYSDIAGFASESFSVPGISTTSGPEYDYKIDNIIRFGIPDRARAV